MERLIDKTELLQEYELYHFVVVDLTVVDSILEHPEDHNHHIEKMENDYIFVLISEKEMIFHHLYIFHKIKIDDDDEMYLDCLIYQVIETHEKNHGYEDEYLV